MGVSPGDFIALSLTTDLPAKPLGGGAWRKAFEAFIRTIRATAREYPPGFTVDVSRGAMYADP